jgi:beta-glucosidase
VDPQFCFGHGLSYTTFEYSDLSLNQADSAQPLQVAFSVSNAGVREGTETPQLYLEYPDPAEQPPRVLRGFTRLELAPGDTRQVVISLGPREFRAYDPRQHDFYVPSGTYRIRVGSSSRDLRLETVLTVVGTDDS